MNLNDKRHLFESDWLKNRTNFSKAFWRILPGCNEEFNLHIR